MLLYFANGFHFTAFAALIFRANVWRRITVVDLFSDHMSIFLCTCRFAVLRKYLRAAYWQNRSRKFILLSFLSVRLSLLLRFLILRALCIGRHIADRAHITEGSDIIEKLFFDLIRSLTISIGHVHDEHGLLRVLLQLTGRFCLSIESSLIHSGVLLALTSVVFAYWRCDRFLSQLPLI